MSGVPTVADDDPSTGDLTREQVREIIVRFLLPLSHAARSFAESQGMTLEQLVAELERDAAEARSDGRPRGEMAR